MWSVDEIKKWTCGLWMAVSVILFAACEKGEQPLLGELVIDGMTYNTVYCHVEVIGGEPDECTFYYATSKKEAEKNKTSKVKGVFDGSVYNGTLGDLNPNTTYYIRACAINSNGRTNTTTVSTKTPPRVPAIGDNDYPTID